MKTILAATDFSKASRHAVTYAAEMAKKCKAKLVLLHSYLPPVMLSDVPVVIPGLEELEKDALKIMRRTVSGLHLKHGRGLKVEMVCKYAMAVDAIRDYASENKVDLIIMGMRGASVLSEKLLGSITTDVIKQSHVPVMSIGHKVKFKAPKNIVFATDYQQIESPSALDPLKTIATLFKSNIHVLNVVPKATAIPTVSQAAEGIKIEHLLEGYKHNFHAIVNKNVADGINEFVKLRKADLVVMIPRKHNIFQTVFKGRSTKQVAFHTNVPLLTIHE